MVKNYTSSVSIAGPTMVTVAGIIEVAACGAPSSGSGKKRRMAVHGRADHVGVAFSLIRFVLRKLMDWTEVPCNPKLLGSAIIFALTRGHPGTALFG